MGPKLFPGKNDLSPQNFEYFEVFWLNKIKILSLHTYTFLHWAGRAEWWRRGWRGRYSTVAALASPLLLSLGIQPALWRCPCAGRAQDQEAKIKLSTGPCRSIGHQWLRQHWEQEIFFTRHTIFWLIHRLRQIACVGVRENRRFIITYGFKDLILCER